MRHRNKLAKLNRAADQRKAMLRAMTSSLLIHEQICVTEARAKALKPLVEKAITLAKRGDLHAIRQAARLVYNRKTGEQMLDERTGKEIPQTVLRKLFRVVGPQYTERQGGYTRIVPAPPRRGDAAPMAVIELV